MIRKQRAGGGDKEDRRLSESNVECQEERDYIINKTEKCPLAVKRSMAASVKIAPLDCRKVLSDVKDMDAVDVNVLLSSLEEKEERLKKSYRHKNI